MKPLSLYIHVPFCRSKCGYCSFLSAPPASAEEVDAWAAAVERELWLHRLLLGPRPLRTVYFGGGTPSLLNPARIGSILNAADRFFGITAGAEITFEANPTSQLGAAWLQEARAAGANRLSIGVQTFQPQGLAILGRRQQPEDPAVFIDAARNAKFENLSLDLVFGIPNCSIDDWSSDIEKALALTPEHLSVYCLEIHPGTPLGLRADSGEVSELGETLQETMYFEAVRRIESAGLAQYEISNFALPGRESAHNLAYWRSDDYLGVGPGAASHLVGDRRVNLADGAAWRAAIAAGAVPVAWGERLSSERRLRERAVMRLRLREGFVAGGFESEFGPRHTAALRATCDALGPRLERIGPDAFRLPVETLFVSNDTLARLIL